MEWVSVEEGLPTCSGPVLGYLAGEVRRYRYTNGIWCYGTHHPYQICERRPTYWMEVPPPPAKPESWDEELESLKESLRLVREIVIPIVKRRGTFITAEGRAMTMEDRVKILEQIEKALE